MRHPHRGDVIGVHGVACPWSVLCAKGLLPDVNERTAGFGFVKTKTVLRWKEEA